MRRRAIQTLMRINSIYATPPANLIKAREKQKKHPEKPINIGRKAMINSIFMTVLYGALFGFTAWVSPMTKYPTIFTMGVGIFLVITLCQGFLTFFSVFYESKDLGAYLPLPFKQSEVLTAKTLISLSTLGFSILPIFCYFIALGLQSPVSNYLAIPMAVFAALLLLLTTILWIIIAVHFITQTSFFKKHQKISSNILTTITLVVMVVALVAGNLMQNGVDGKTGKEAFRGFSFLPIDVFAKWLLDPSNLVGLLGVFFWLLLCLVSILLLRMKVLPTFYSNLQVVEDLGRAKEEVTETKLLKVKSYKRISDFVLHYHKRLLSDGTILSQTVLMATMLPFLFLFGIVIQLLRERETVHQLLSQQLAFLSPVALTGAALAFLMVHEASLIGISISLERENYSFLRTLPFDMRDYLRSKFYLVLAIQSSLPLLTLLILGVILRIPFPFILLCQLFWLLTAYSLAVKAYIWDMKNLTVDWTNLVEVLNRSMKGKKTFFLYISYFFLLAIPMIAVFLAHLFPILAYILLGLVSLSLCVWAYLSYRKFQNFLEEYGD